MSSLIEGERPMSMIIKRRGDRVLENEILRKARTKMARTNDTSDFDRVAKQFVEAVYNIRNIMKEEGSTRNYDNFFGGFEQCAELLKDPAFKISQKAQYAYTALLGVDAWLKHEADKLGEKYVSPNHFYIAWLNENIDLRGLDV